MNDTFRDLVLGVFLAIMIGWILHVGRGVILPVVFSLVIVYIVLGLAELIGRTPVLRHLVPGPLRHLLAVAIMIAALLAILSLFFTNIAQIASRAPAYQDRIIEAIQTVAVRFGVETEPTWETIRNQVLGRIDLPRTLGATLASASSIFASFMLALLYAWFVLLERGLFRRKIDRLSDDPGRNAEILRVLRTVNSRVGVYLAMKTAVNVLLGTICYVILRVAGIEFAVFWAFLIGVTNYIPYVGSFIGVLFPVALAIVQFGAPGPVLALGAALTAAQITVGNFVEPFVMGNSLNLSPMVIMLSLVVWSALWGLPGAILAVPITASLMIVLSEFPQTRVIAVLLSREGDVARTPAAPTSL